jgi:superfamily II DNA/RNA helicase
LPPTFPALGVPDALCKRLASRGITEPFAIQSAALAPGLAGRDVCGKAPTGSGKTIAFAVPVAMRVTKARSRRPRALVLVPTRELAAQVTDEIRPLASARGRTVASFYGGVGYGLQRKALASAVDIAVGCPGRLEDLASTGSLILDEVEIVVVDEADRMADMGFLPAVRRLLDQAKPDRQTMLFSATLDGEIDVLVKRYQRDPAICEAAPGKGVEQGEVEHRFWKAERSARLGLTATLVGKEWPAIVFCRTKHGADRVSRQLAAAGVSATAIHGDRTQRQRERALAQFMAGRVQALVATDVAARGIHVDSVACVVHYDPPADHKDYVHRSGRTGRAGQDGLVVSMVDAESASAVRKLQKILGLPQQLTTPDGVTATGVAGGGPVAGHARGAPGTSGRPQPGARPLEANRAPRRNQRSYHGGPAKRSA